MCRTACFGKSLRSFFFVCFVSTATPGQSVLRWFCGTGREKPTRTSVFVIVVHFRFICEVGPGANSLMCTRQFSTRRTGTINKTKQQQHQQQEAALQLSPVFPDRRSVPQYENGENPFTKTGKMILGGCARAESSWWVCGVCTENGRWNRNTYKLKTTTAAAVAT